MPTLPRPLAALLGAGLLTATVSGCDSLDQASETLDRAQACATALQAASFTPNVADPQQSVEEARAKAEQLRELADRVADVNLQRELQEMADSLGRLDLSALDATALAEWTEQKVQQLQQLQRACS